jgi:WD40 repeat protein
MSACPAAADLRRYLAGGLAAAAEQGLAAHVEGCAACQRALDALTDEPAPPAPIVPALPPTLLRRLADAPPGPDTAALPDRRPDDAAPPARIGPYQVLRELGRGGMGVVYLARHEPLRREVALKLLRAAAVGADAARLRAEAEAVARLQHPNIVQVFDVGSHDDRPYLALEYVPGGSLADALRGRPQRPQDAAALVEALARAVQHAHERGVVHRDLKPSNVLLQKTEDRGQRTEQDGSSLSSVLCPLSSCVPKVADFGLARLLDASASGQGVVGTPCYMAPEQVTEQGRAAGPAADVYALGGILYELLTGHPPFLGDSPEATIMQAVVADPAPPRRLVASCPPDLEAVCLRCLEKRPQDRYRSAAELADDLGRWRRGEPTRARPPGPLGRAGKWARRRPAVAGLLAALLLVTAVGFGLVLWQWGEAVQGRREADEQHRRADERAADAEEKGRQAQAARGAARSALYASLIRQAELEWRDRRFAGALEALRDCPEELRGWEWRHLRHAVEGGGVGLPEAPKDARALAWACDGRLAVGDEAGVVRIYAGGRLLRTMAPAGERVSALAFGPDGRSLAVGLTDRVLLRDAVTGRDLAVCEGHSGGVSGLAFSPDGTRLLSGSDGGLRLWDAEGGQAGALERGKGLLRTVGFSGDGRRVAVCRDDMVALRPAGGGEPTATLRLSGTVALAALAGDRRLAYARRAPGGVQQVAVLDLPTGRELFAAAEPGNRIWAVAISADGLMVATGREDGSIAVRDGVTGREGSVLRGHAGRVWALAFGPDRRLASAGADGCKVWRQAEGPYRRAIAGGPVLAVSPVSPALAAAGDGRPVRLLNLSGRVERELGPPGPVAALAYSPDGTRLAAACGDVVQVWRAGDGQPLCTCRGHGAAVRAVAFAPDGARLASAALDGTWRLWDGSGRQLASGGGHGAAVWAVAFHPTDGRLATCGAEGGVRLWGADGRLLCVLEAGRLMRALAFRPDGRLLAAAGGGSAHVWDADSGAERYRLTDEAAQPALAFSPDGTRLALGVWRVVQVRDAATGRLLIALPLGRSVTGAAFTHDGRYLTVADDQGTVTLWDAPP